MKEKNFKRNMLLNATGNLLYLGAQWIVTVLVTRLGSFTSAGILSVAMSLSSVFQTVAFFGIRNFQVSDIQEKYADATYLSLRHICSLFAALGGVVTALVLGYRGEELLASVLYLLFRIAEGYSDVLHGIAQRRGRLDVAGIGFAVKGVALLAGFLLGFLPTRSLTAGLAAMTAASLLTTLLYDLPKTRSIRRFPLSVQLRPCLALARETAPLCLYLFLYSALSSVPKFVLEGLCGTEALGAYASIFAPALLVIAAAGYLYNPFAPTFARLCAQGNERGFRRLFRGILLALVLALLLCLGLGALLGEWALVLLFGESIRPHAYLLPFVLVAVFAVAVVAFLSLLATVRRRLALLCIGMGAGTAGALLFSFLFIPVIGENGASVALALASATSVAILLPTALIPKKEDRPS